MRTLKMWGRWTGLALVTCWPTQFLWNSTGADLFGLPALTFMQVVGLMFYAPMLIGPAVTAYVWAAFDEEHHRPSTQPGLARLAHGDKARAASKSN